MSAPGRRRGGVGGGASGWPKAWPELVAGVLTALVYCVAQVLADRYPFGATTRNVNDLGAQLVPMHALYRDVLTGQAQGDLFLNWNSGLGVPFLPDVVTYLGSPLSLLVLAFPRSQIDLALFVVQVLTMAIAAGAMTTYLRRVAPGPWPVAAALGAAYGTCGWAVDDAGYLLPWLSGLVALPLLLVVGEWAQRDVRPLLGPALVALVWASNFYTAYMATIGAAAFLLARLVALAPGWRHAVLTVARLAWTVAAGVLLAAPLLVPVLRANQAAQPSVGQTPLTASLADAFARLLPGTEGVGVSPGFTVTTAVLLLAAMLPWSRHVPARARAAYSGGLAVVVASMFWFPTHLAWHGFDPPQGSPYRQAFVVAGWLVVLAWTTVSRAGRDVVALGGGLLTVGAVVALAQGSERLHPVTVPVLVVSLALLVAGVAAAARGRGALLAGVVVLVVAVEATLTSTVVAQAHARLSKRPAWNPLFADIRHAALQADAWPATRTTVGAGRALGASAWTAANDPMLLGGQGVGYYSSHMPTTTSSTLRGLGVSWTNFGRSVVDLPDRGRDAVLGIGKRVVREDPAAVHVREAPAAPLVAAREPPQRRDNPFLARNELAAAQAYVLPPVQVLGPADGEVTLVAECPAGTTVHLWAPMTVGTARLGDGPEQEILPPGARRPGVVIGSGPISLGAAPGTEVAVHVRSDQPLNLPAEPIACFDEAALREGIDRLAATGADVEAGGHSFTATWDEPVQGDALALVPRIRGWTCSTGAGWTPPGSAAGFISVEMQGASQLACRFRPPGLVLGLLIAAGALVALTAPIVLHRRRASRRVS